MCGRFPLVVILGATGSGKTKLSLDMARKFQGEIIGADSMQVYKALDIITAKATKEEQALVPHHLIDILEPHESFTVYEYRNKALTIIDNLLGQNKLPIVVGGTNYYIESLLWKILVDDPDTSLAFPPNTSPFPDHELPSEELHKKLKLVDPHMAERLHPNNKRKILRSLEVLHLLGRKHSEILAEQHHSKDGSKSGGGLRYRNALIFHLQCDKSVLDERLNSRVGTMIDKGLIEELTNFHKMYNEGRVNKSESPDYTKGIFQSIGLKEFHPYLMLSDEERNSEKGRAIFCECVEELKMMTRRYAKKQNRWTINRFLGRQDREVPPMYGLDTNDVDQWNTNVTVPAMKIIQDHLDGVPSTHRRLSPQQAKSTPNAEDKSFFCDICQRVFVGKLQWDDHLKSNKHKRMRERKSKIEKSKINDLEVL